MAADLLLYCRAVSIKISLNFNYSQVPIRAPSWLAGWLAWPTNEVQIFFSAKLQIKTWTWTFYANDKCFYLRQNKAKGKWEGGWMENENYKQKLLATCCCCRCCPAGGFLFGAPPPPSPHWPHADPNHYAGLTRRQVGEKLQQLGDRENYTFFIQLQLQLRGYKYYMPGGCLGD